MKGFQIRAQLGCQLCADARPRLPRETQFCHSPRFLSPGLLVQEQNSFPAMVVVERPLPAWVRCESAVGSARVGLLWVGSMQMAQRATRVELRSLKAQLQRAPSYPPKPFLTELTPIQRQISASISHPVHNNPIPP